MSSGEKGKQKADKNRARVEENFLKLTHVQRQEAAQSRREEKKRAEKERIMNEEDPEKQRRLEVKWIFFELLKMLTPIFFLLLLGLLVRFLESACDLWLA